MFEWLQERTTQVSIPFLDASQHARDMRNTPTDAQGTYVTLGKLQSF